MFVISIDFDVSKLPFSVGPPAANIALSGDITLGKVYDPGFFIAPLNL